MRVLLASWTSRQAGGTETYLSRIAGLLSEAGCDVAFAHEVDAPADRSPIVLPPASPVFDLSRGVDGARDWRPEVIYAHGLLDPDREARLIEVAPAVYFAHSYYGTCISGDKTNRLPVVQPCARHFGPACLAHFYPRRCGGLSPATMLHDYVRQRRRLALLRRYAAVVTHTEHMRRELERHGAGGGRVLKIGFATGMSDAAEALPVAAAREPGGVARLLFVGRMDRLKGGDYLLRALPAVAAAAGPVHLTLAGDGPERRAWEQLADEIQQRSSGVEVTFAGWLDRPRITALLDRSDILVVPSLWPEPFGLVGPEANRRGVPAVAFATGGIPEWLHEGVNGSLAPADPPTVDGLSRAVVRTITSLRAGDALRDGALRMSLAWLDRTHVAALLGVFADVAGQRRAAS